MPYGLRRLERARSADYVVIVEGERNDRLFRVGCALWGKGEVSGCAELFHRLMETNIERVSPPLDSDEVFTEDTTAQWTPEVLIEGRANVVGAMRHMSGSDEIVTYHHVASMTPVVDGDTDPYAAAEELIAAL